MENPGIFGETWVGPIKLITPKYLVVGMLLNYPFGNKKNLKILDLETNEIVQSLDSNEVTTININFEKKLLFVGTQRGQSSLWKFIIE